MPTLLKFCKRPRKHGSQAGASPGLRPNQDTIAWPLIGTFSPPGGEKGRQVMAIGLRHYVRKTRFIVAVQRR
jgi:hypothetical protein